MTHPRGIALAASLLLSAGLSAEVRAQPASPPAGLTPKQQAVLLVRRGNAMRNLGKYADAIKLYDQAAKLTPKLAGLWRHKGLAHEGLKQWKQAMEAYEEYIKLAGTGGTYSHQVMARINDMRKKLGLPPKIMTALGQPATLIVKVNVPGALITLDGVNRGTATGQALRIPAGVHVLRVSKRPKFLTWTKNIGVKAGRSYTFDVVLQKNPNYKPPRVVRIKDPRKKKPIAYLTIKSDAEGARLFVAGREVPKGTDGSFVIPFGKQKIEVRAPGRVTWRARVETYREQKKTIEPVLASESRRRTYRIWGWATLGLAGALAIVGGAFGALENRIHEKVRDRAADDRDELRRLARKGTRYKNISIGMFATGAAALTASLVLWIYERRGVQPKEGRLPLVNVGPTDKGSGVALSLSGEF